VSGTNQPLEWDRVKLADDYIKGDGLRSLGLPIAGLGRHARTGQLRLFLPPSAGGQNQFLKNVTFGFLSGMEERITIVDGKAPQPAHDLKQPVEVMLMRDLADELGVNVGDQFTLVGAAGGNVVSIPIRIAGLWAPLNAKDTAWFFPPSAFKDVI